MHSSTCAPSWLPVPAMPPTAPWWHGELMVASQRSSRLGIQRLSSFTREVGALRELLFYHSCT